MAYKIVVDAGHGGSDPGAVYNGRQEKDDTLALAMRVGNYLSNAGFSVDYTRTTDVYDTPFEKATKANQAGANLFVSIHRNSSPTANTYDGVQTLVYNDSGMKAQLARNINDNLEALGFRNLGVVERPNLVVLRRTKMPAVLVEVGFINSDQDNERFDGSIDEIAEGIADAIIDTLGSQGIYGNGGMNYAVQIGAFRNRNLAIQLTYELRNQGFQANIVMEDGLYKVRIGDFASLDAAVELEQTLRMMGYNTFIVS
ncbi:MAG: N-acetylmuramoyl-L-alanine amidase [Eubacterium sp.]|nr:N-acetylmuramoyl-L-alanine amidase [Eubacterium sp.]